MAEIVVKLVNGELAGKTAQSIAKEVNAAALALKKAEVGTQAWVDANKKLEGAKQTQADLKKQIEGTASASDMLKKAWNQLPGAQFFNQISDSFGMMKSGVGGLVSQFGVLKTAIIASGIGALVLVIASLVSWFAKTDEGATKLDGILRAIGNTVDVLLNRLINLRQSLTTLFTNPGQFFRGLIADIKEGIDLGQELANTFDDLDQKRRDMELADASQNTQIQKLLLQSKNVALSYQERLAILDRVDAMERENYQTKLKYAVDFANAVVKETEFMEKNGTITDEQLDKQNEARIKLLEVQKESFTLQEKIENRRSLILEQQQNDRNREIAAEQKKNDQLLKEQEKFYQDKNAIDQKQQEFLDAREANQLQKAEARARTSMLAALAILKQRTDAENEAAANRKAIAEAEEAMRAEELAVFNEGTNSIIALLGATVEARRKNANAIKTLQIGQVIVNGVAEVSEIAKTFAALGPVGQLLAGFRIAFAVARTAAGVARIQSQKFALGGPIVGPSHSGGGVPIEAEGGEFIFSRKATSAIGVDRLNAINNRLTFANGGPVSPYSGSAQNSPSGVLFDYDKLSAVINTYVDRKLMRLQVVNNLQDTEKGLQVLNSIRNEADV